MDEFVSVSRAAALCGVTPGTVRSWTNAGLLPHVRVGPRRDRRIRVGDLYTLCQIPVPVPAPAVTSPVRVGVYVRVSSSSGQESSLAAQEAELRAVAVGEHGEDVSVTVYRDKRSGLSQSRPGLDRLLAAAKGGVLDVVLVTHQDRLARFGVAWLEELLGAYGVSLMVVHEESHTSGTEELVADFVSLVACFSGRIYGQRSAAARRRLLAAAADGLPA